MNYATFLVLTPVFISAHANAYELRSKNSTLDIKGRIEARANYSKGNQPSSVEDKSRARLTLLGESRLTGTLTGFAKFETQASSQSRLSHRYLFAGIKSPYGQFSFGQQDSAATKLANVTDVLLSFSPQAIDLLPGSKKRQNNTLLWQSEMSGTTISAY